MMADRPPEMRKYFIQLLLMLQLIWLPNHTESARILAMFSVHGKSHYIMFETLLKELASRGHQVDVVTHYKQKHPVPNLHEINIENTTFDLVNNIPYFAVEHITIPQFVQQFWTFHWMDCANIMKSEEIQPLIKTEATYDLIILEAFTIDCFLGFAHKFKAPLIMISSSHPMHWGYERLGNPDNPSYMPSYFSSSSHEMTFIERLINTVTNIGTSLANKYYMIQTHDSVQKYFGEDMPHYSDLVKRTSIYLVNSHFSIDYPKPLLPSIIDVGGLHIRKPKHLPQDLEKFMNESEHGVIYISFGTLLRLDTFPEDLMKKIIDALSQFPQRVIWKGSGEKSIFGLTSKFKTAEWMPQNDILHHPKTVAFFTHGGTMSTMEAMHAGVPLIVMPFTADQFHNARSYESKGIAVTLNFKNITTEGVFQAFKAVLTNVSYRENAQRLSRLFQDRPQSPLDTAVFWVEYVIRHRGAPHLRSAAVDMPLYQYLLLDVISALVTVLAVLLYCIYKLLKMLLPCQVYKKEKIC